MTLRIAVRLLRVLAHLLRGLVICALVFPWLGRLRRAALMERWSAQLLRIFDVSVALAPGSSRPACGLWVANHVSWIDVFVINALFPSRFVAKSEVRRWPLVGPLSAWAGTIFVARDKRRDLRRTMADMVAALEAGERVAVFPEGTSSAQGAMQAFRPNLFEAAILARAAIVPVAISYFDERGRAHRGVEYIGTTSLIESMVAILSGGPIHARLHIAPALAPAPSHRRQAAQEAFEVIFELLEKQLERQPRRSGASVPAASAGPG